MDQLATTMAGRWARHRAQRTHRLSAVEARPSSRYLLLTDYLASSGLNANECTAVDHDALAAFAEAHSGEFRYQSTTMKRMIGGWLQRKIAAGEEIPAEFEPFYNAAAAEAVRWADVKTAPSRVIVPELRKQVRAAFGAKLHVRGEFRWRISAPRVEIDTVLNFGGAFCQFGYHRMLHFSDGSHSDAGTLWEEDLGANTPEWDLMTAESVGRDITQLMFFTRDVVIALEKLACETATDR